MQNPGNYSSVAYFIGRGGVLAGEKKCTLVLNQGRLALNTDDGHVVFDEPLTNIKQVRVDDWGLIVVMPTGSAYVYLADPKESFKDVALSAATSVVGAAAPAPAAIAGDVAGYKLAEEARKELLNPDEATRWEQALQGQVKVVRPKIIMGDSLEKFSVGMGALLMVVGGLTAASAIYGVFQNQLQVALYCAIFAVVVGGFGFWLSKRFSFNPKAQFPSSR